MEKAACVHRGQDQKETWNGGWDRSRQGEEDEDSRDDVETFLSAESEFDVDSPPPPPTSSLEERDGVPSLAGGQLDVDEMSLTPFTKMYRTKVNDYRPAGKEVQLLIPNGREEVNKLNTMDEDCHIKVAAQSKTSKHLTYLVRTQTINGLEGDVHIIRFSKTCSFIASAGSNLVICIWKVCDNEDLAQQIRRITGNIYVNGKEGTGLDPRLEYSTLRLIEEEPLQRLKGHTADIKDIAWSKQNFLLSCANDRTVRLWHPELSSSCLKVFKHPHFVTCVSFNPIDENVFLSGCADMYMRIFSIHPSPIMQQEINVKSVPTTIATDDTGHMAIFGTSNGHIKFYILSSNGARWRMRHKTDQEISGRKRQTGSIKINNIDIVGNEYVVSCDDSLIRIYRLADYTLLRECRGHKVSSHLSCSLSPGDAQFVLVGSELNSIYVYNLREGHLHTKLTDKRRVLLATAEHFKAQEGRMTCAYFFPRLVRPWGVRTQVEYTTRNRAGGKDVYEPSSSQHSWRPSSDTLTVEEKTLVAQSIDRLNCPKRYINSTAANLPAAGLLILSASLDGNICVYYNVGTTVETLKFLS